MTNLRDVITDTISQTSIDHIVTSTQALDLIDEIMEALTRAGAPENFWSLEDARVFHERIADIADQVTLNENFQIRIGRDEEIENGRYFYQIVCWRKDVITGVEEWGYGGKAFLSRHASDSELVQTIFGLYKAYWEHESRESFQWNGRRVFGPHIATQALWQVAQRVDVRSVKHEGDTPLAVLKDNLNRGVVGTAMGETSIPIESQFAIMDKLNLGVVEVDDSGASTRYRTFRDGSDVFGHPQ